MILWIYEECRCHRRSIWITMQSIYKGVLMVKKIICSAQCTDNVHDTLPIVKVIGSRFAWATRNVHIAALNDSTYVGMSLYNAVLLSITTAVVGYFLRDQHERSYILTSIFILLCVTITLCLVFVPKLLEVAKDPRSKAKPQRAVLNHATVKSSSDHEGQKQRQKSLLQQLTNENNALLSNANQVRADNK
jgi:gamma-aminobutyric acid type B receptor